ncbi:Rv1355c family protein [Dyadobacter sp. CY312]|uniref:Rv1355c family protein n=1 Tax=Dyadobacter sp. CY312 TaxID=2907303 RepID=UPI001F002504|nr:Rv1355c family protein [Dyadobacter sp. CY312]MCE7042555.1 Rv1355c family protein [Dyadobacter sp. CY312]
MHHKQESDRLFSPIVFAKDQNSKAREFKAKKKDSPDTLILDLFESQKKEIFKIQNPGTRFSDEDLNRIYSEWVKGKNPDDEGTWVYYPWSYRLIHLLDREEFITLRTSRNHHKISPGEQADLFEKTIGIIGLSVGHSVAISIATERICGKLKLADFDTIELSNLNRLKTGLHNIGLNKCVVTAREIAEIDPFIEIECYTEGINDQNMQRFMTEGGKLDILIDECDDIEIKIACRNMAKQNHIPVVMETSDRGMLDVERFDLETNRPILHGLLAGIPDEKLKNISPQDRVPLIMRMVDATKGSVRGRASLLEVGQSISTWPQLASAVTLGGGVVTDVARRILLHQFTDSGRYYVDLEQLIANQNPTTEQLTYTKIPLPFNLPEAVRIADSLPYKKVSHLPSETELNEIIEAAGQAPSSGNEQAWKWVFRNGRLHLFQDRSRSFSFANVDNAAAYLSLGAAYENVVLKSYQLGFGVDSAIFPLGEKSDLIAAIYFRDLSDPGVESVPSPELHEYIGTRSTNRTVSAQSELDSEDRKVFESLPDNPTFTLKILTDKQQISQIGAIAGECDLITLLNEHGHHDYFERNTRWTTDEYSRSNDGIPLQVPGNAPPLIAALTVLRDKKVASALRTIGGGNALVQASGFSASSASGIGVLSMTSHSPEGFLRGGMLMQKIWLKATQLGYTLQPLFTPISLFRRMASGAGLEEDEKEKLKKLSSKFRTIANLQKNEIEVFLFKLARADKQSLSTKRLPINEILFRVNDSVE